ncbi:GntR family transcriptional regulator [Streptomyces europaeiscabiei]|uniref:GntR family transcriptional regulator n=1 Tax=Streptomyces TaxID=1883 RepID=UPI000A381BD5|nr:MULTISPECIES: GntR family transcriptional regulator [Streptomyces]MDX3588514.1 GntR family transcriptional regulator [Streptomyces europaeiscabiei]MDX3613897.1 GntR family transcriptional regulator [Streptomyces europaeiscabiei]MDX3630369.1 GntR family transcriptional regulator [Streptomyces europaeiscabiei]MDX3648506.1 GntR family transcriptional regulator [Streptomyces europaeiscabiei]WUD30975.1 GntR family transcriptional regulator [Streptomyces europaeiscabiei]
MTARPGREGAGANGGRNRLSGEASRCVAAGHVASRRTSVEIHDRLRRLILEDVLPVGAELRQAEPARRSEVGRTPLREAFRMLQEEGLIDTGNQPPRTGHRVGRGGSGLSVRGPDRAGELVGPAERGAAHTFVGAGGVRPAPWHGQG